MVRSDVFSLLTCAVVALLGAPVVQVNASPMELYGINYNTRNGPDWAASEQKCKSPAEIDADLKAISSVTKRIRIYSLTDCNQGKLVLEAAAKVPGMRVELGLWVSADASVFQAEKARLLELVSATGPGLITNNLVTAIHVGSEAVYRKEVTAAQIIDYMKEIKTIAKDYALQVPITIADIGDVYIAHPELVDAVDFVSANGFPFWEQKPVMGAATYFHERMKPLMAMADKQKKEFVISETGWASDGVNVNASIASPENAAQYLKEFLDLATKWKFYYFEAFDEPWKVTLDAKNTVEGYFGIFHANRTLKSHIAALGLKPPVGPQLGGQEHESGAVFNGATPSQNDSGNGASSPGNNGATTGNNGATSPSNNGAASSGTNGSASSGNNSAASTGNNSAASTGNNGAATPGSATTESGAAYPHPDCPV